MRVESMVMSSQQGSPLIRSKSVGGTGAMKSTSPASSAATRVAGSLIGVKTMRSTLPGRRLVPIFGEALELEFHPLLALGDDERTCAGDIARGERRAMLGDVVLGAAALVCAGVEFAIHGEDVGREIEHERIRAFGDEVDGEVVDRLRFAERLVERLEVRALLQPIERPHHVRGGERAAGVELHALAQMETRGALVDLLPACRKPRLERQVLAEAQQRIEGQMRELERGACQLLVGVERGWICVIGHAQRLGRNRQTQCYKRDSDKRKQPEHASAVLVSCPQRRASSSTRRQKIQGEHRTLLVTGFPLSRE